MTQPWVPTVDDLRVKLCYICREEEHYDKPQEPTVAWVHPCNCTLVAHESCLLHWIQAAQQDASRAGNALKCPQCGAVYELESENPFLLRLLNNINSSISLAGKAVTVVGFACVLVSFASGVYIICTSYGAYAVQEFLGKELYNTLLTDDPSNWPWHAFINLPLIPLSLIFSRTATLSSFPLVPLFLAWTTSRPVPTTERLMTASWSRALTTTETYPFAPILNWPPSPIMATLLFPFITGLYRRYMSRLRHWVMGTQPTLIPPIRRIIWALNEDGPAQLRVHIGANVDRGQAQDDQQQPQQQGPARQDNQERDRDGENAEGDDEEEPQDPGAVAERTIRVTTGQLGRYVGGALMVPAISNWMGSILYRLSKHSSLLRIILAVRPPRTSPPDYTRRWFEQHPPGKMGIGQQIALGMRLALNAVFGGTKTFAECDPVWWRNSIGLGIFVFAKDCIILLHLYLTKREIQTRKVKNRSFAGVDIRELDLINPPAPQSPTAAQSPSES